MGGVGGEDCPVKVSSSVFASVFEKAFDDSNNNLVDSQDREQKQDRKQFLQPKVDRFGRSGFTTEVGQRPPLTFPWRATLLVERLLQT